MQQKPQILSAVPAVGIPGGEVVLTCDHFDISNFSRCKVLFGGSRGRIVSASDRRVVVGIPETLDPGDCRAGLRLVSDGIESDVYPFVVAELLADNLHPVASPAYDYDSGTTYTTISGSRGKKVDVSVWRISSDGEATPFLSDITNPTGLAFDRDGTLFVTSRFDGTVYRISPFKEAEAFATDLGVATGIAFDRNGTMFVGDRQGVVYQVNSLGGADKFASLDASVSAYHLAFHPDGDLFVTAPTAAGSRESVLRIDRDGQVTKFFTGLGRPQGLAFDVDGNLYVVASLNGSRGLIRISADGQRAETVVAGTRLVGVAFDDLGNAILTTTRELFRVPLGVKGYLPTYSN